MLNDHHMTFFYGHQIVFEKYFQNKGIVDNGNATWNLLLDVFRDHWTFYQKGSLCTILSFMIQKKRNKTLLPAMKYQHVTSSHKLMCSHLEHSSIISYKSFFNCLFIFRTTLVLNLLQKFQRFLNCPSALNHKAVEWSALCNNHKHMTVISGHCGDSLRIYS